jgi:hypothetical protein
VTITAAGLSQGGLFVVFLRLIIFFTLALPRITVGAAIGSLKKRRAWCVAASHPIACCMSMLNPRSLGIPDFPPVLLATLLGFGAMARLSGS